MHNNDFQQFMIDWLKTKFEGAAVLIDKIINANGVYLASDDNADGFKKVTVNVPQPSGTKQISITQNGTTTEDVEQYEDAEITVNVPNTYTAGDEGKVVSGGALVSQTEHAQITANGSYDTTLNNSVEVTVSASLQNYDLLCDETLTEDITAFRYDLTSSQLAQDYKHIFIKIDNVGSAPQYPYPSFNTTSKNFYINSQPVTLCMAMPDPEDTTKGHIGYNYPNYNFNYPIMFFYLQPYYNTESWKTGTRIRLWGMK